MSYVATYGQDAVGWPTGFYLIVFDCCEIALMPNVTWVLLGVASRPTTPHLKSVCNRSKLGLLLFMSQSLWLVTV